jgi:hypothetical protein
MLRMLTGTSEYQDGFGSESKFRAQNRSVPSGTWGFEHGTDAAISNKNDYSEVPAYQRSISGG